jgi:predicted O-linked N-acetylglucosamine transferase (SPINDLY family)
MSGRTTQAAAAQGYHVLRPRPRSGPDRLVEARQLLAAGRAAGVPVLLQPVLGDPGLRSEAQYMIAIAGVLSGQPQSGFEAALDAVRSRPNEPRYRFTLGRVFKALGDLPNAERAYREAITLDPRYADAHVSLGIVLKLRGDIEGALAQYDAALAIAPDFAPAHANRANALALRAELTADDPLADTPNDEAIEAQARAAALDPRNALVHRNHGILLGRARRRLQAAEAFNNALGADPSDVESCLYLAGCLRSIGSSALAREVYEKWLGHNPPNAAVMRALAGLLTRDGLVDDALPWATRAAELDPDPHSLLQLGNSYLQLRRQEDAMAHFRRGVDLGQRRPNLYTTMLLGANYLWEDPQRVFDLHAEFGASLPPQRASRPRWRPLAAGERLKIGYVSGDFVRHSVSYFLGGLLEHHDRERFDVTCYNNLAWSDAVTERLKSYGHRWVECEGISHEQLCRQIEADGIHVLIDLAGHTSHSRLFMFALGAAPVQITYLGYPTVNGVPAMDFRITDPEIDAGDLPALASEQPLRLTRTMFCYRPDEAPAIGPPPLQRKGHVTFGSFNSIAKISDRTLALWARVMHAVPDSRLMLKSSAMAQASNCENIERWMAGHGIGTERLQLMAWLPNKASHLELYNEIDVALDPFPYNGATTTCEALWMGVPVVSLRGRTHTSRMGASILKGAGKPEWVSTNDDAYVATAQAIANDVEGLVAWRCTARASLARSALFDERGFTNAFEDLLREAWQRAGERVVETASVTAV